LNEGPGRFDLAFFVLFAVRRAPGWHRSGGGRESGFVRVAQALDRAPILNVGWLTLRRGCF
jgi:hypothetical protein